MDNSRSNITATASVLGAIVAFFAVVVMLFGVEATILQTLDGLSTRVSLCIDRARADADFRHAWCGELRAWCAVS